MSLLSFLEGIEIQDSLKWSFRCRENYCCLPLPAFPLVIKNPPANAGDVRDSGSIPGSGRSPEAGTAAHSSMLATPIWVAVVNKKKQKIKDVRDVGLLMEM